MFCIQLIHQYKHLHHFCSIADTNFDPSGKNFENNSIILKISSVDFVLFYKIALKNKGSAIPLSPLQLLVRHRLTPMMTYDPCVRPLAVAGVIHGKGQGSSGVCRVPHLFQCDMNSQRQHRDSYPWWLCVVGVKGLERGVFNGDARNAGVALTSTNTTLY